MFDYTGQIVQATAGRDKGGVFCVVAMDQRQERLLLADGKRRKVSRPKAKKLGHVRQLTEVRQEYDHPAIHKLRQGEPVSDRELRRALAAFKEGILHAVHKRVDHKGRLIQRNVGLISQGFDQLAFVHDNSVKSAVLL